MKVPASLHDMYDLFTRTPEAGERNKATGRQGCLSQAEEELIQRISTAKAGVWGHACDNNHFKLSGCCGDILDMQF